MYPVASVCLSQSVYNRRGELDFSRVNLATYTGDGRLPMPVPHLGTLYLTVSRTLILLCKPSNAILKPFYFPHKLTSTLSAFEVRYKKLRYINPLLLLLIDYCKQDISKTI